MTLFLGGDVMTGRGVDQIQRHPSRPRLREAYVQDARQYVAIAEAHSGPIAAPVAPDYIWGDALAEFDRVRPDARLANLETAVTESDAYWPAKGIHYRMHPANIACLSAAGLDVCSLANNHVLDFGVAGLEDTLTVLARAGIRSAGAGRTSVEAQAPAVVPGSDDSRLLVFACADEDSGVTSDWAAADDRPGIDVVDVGSKAATDRILARVARVRRPGDVVVVSLHWGTNWGYEVPRSHVVFAHRLIDGGVHVVHGHSSHHPRPVEVYRGGLILYGCGDFINDYEGIEGYEPYRDDLVLMHFATFAPATQALTALELVPLRIRQMRLHRASREDAAWMRDTLDRINRPFGTRVGITGDGRLELTSDGSVPR
jgi:poly-gamma-glutamate synthesis protein (capsule biosynthesis protein)